MRKLPFITRRALVAAIPAVAAAGLPTSTFGSQPDAELFALRDEWSSTLLGLALCGPPHTAAENALVDAQRADPSQSREDIEKAIGFDVAEAAWDAAVDANTEILDRIAGTRARTLEGLLFKAKVCANSDYYPDLADAIIDDLVAIGGANA